jgi:hypothetical protein
MSDRVSASITLGGLVSAADFEILARLIADESLSTDWDGPWFTSQEYEPGKPLRLKGREVVGGQFDELEAWCVVHGVAFVRWSGGYTGSWSAERVVFTGQGEPTRYAIDEDNVVLVDRATIETLGDLDAVLAYLDAAEFDVPPLVVEELLPANPIAALNDAFRQAPGPGWKFTAAVSVRGPRFMAAVVERVRAFDRFDDGNDPYGEHDFGVVVVEGDPLCWKIDYYDTALKGRSPDPADPAVTKRILTIMFAGDY